MPCRPSWPLRCEPNAHDDTVNPVNLGAMAIPLFPSPWGDLEFAGSADLKGDAMSPRPTLGKVHIVPRLRCRTTTIRQAVGANGHVDSMTTDADPPDPIRTH